MQRNPYNNTLTNLNLILVLLLCFGAYISKADHYFGGYFYYEHIGDKELQVTLITYTDVHKGNSDRDSINFNWGDGQSSFLLRTNNAGEGEEIYEGMKKNIYVGKHEYLKYANYQSYFSDNFRLFDVNNFGIGKSGVTNLRFGGIAPMQDSTIYCVNNSPKPSIDPYFYGKENQAFQLNFGYFDADGDSLSFELTSCKGGNGEAADGYFIPTGAIIDEQNGQFRWPQAKKGKYSFSFLIKEYRNGEKIGQSSSDFTLFISRPEFNALPIGTASSVVGSNNGSYNFNAAENKEFSIEYSHSEADSVSCSVVAGLENYNGFTFTKKQIKTSTTVKDTLSINYDGTTAFNGKNSVVWECIAYLGNDSLVKEYIPLSISVTKKLEWSCLSPNLDEVEEQVPALPTLTVSPNLFNEHVWINVGTDYESIDINIYDLRGRLVRSYINLQQSTVKLDLENLSSAMYILQVFSGENLLHTGKIMKQ